MALTHASLQPLLDQLQGEGTMVSCYADLSIIPGVPRWPGLFKAKTGALKELFTGDQRSWQQIEQNLAAIGRALEAPEARNARSMAVFSALQRGFFQCYPLDVPVENELVVHEAPYLVPLLMALHRQREYLVVLTDTHRGRLYTATVGNVRLLQEIQEEVPSRQHSVGERWGKEQATIARYRENCILHYHKDLVGLIEKAWAEQPFQGIVLSVNTRSWNTSGNGCRRDWRPRSFTRERTPGPTSPSRWPRPSERLWPMWNRSATSACWKGWRIA